MKVFCVQPTTPYQVGDIWVNATYPSDGSTYKNEVLRCQTNKAAGSQFAIGDWIKASKYTDDTVANAAKRQQKMLRRRHRPHRRTLRTSERRSLITRRNSIIMLPMAT